MSGALSSYGRVLKSPHAIAVFLPGFLGRLSYGTVFLSLTVSVAESVNSVKVAGAALSLFGLTNFLSVPYRAALVERLGPRRTLPLMASIYGLLLVFIGSLSLSGLRISWPFYLLAALAGTVPPTLGPTTRALWKRLSPHPDFLQAAYALDTVVEESLYVIGPLIVGLLFLAGPPALGLFLSATLIIVGSVGLALAPVASPAHDERPGLPSGSTTGTRRRALFALRSPICASAGVGLSLGALSLLVVAYAGRHGGSASAAWMQAAVSASSVAGGLIYGARPWKSGLNTRLSTLVMCLGVSVALCSLVHNTWSLLVAVGIAGLFVSPAITTAYLAAEEAIVRSEAIQVGAWVNTAYNAGTTLGSATIGWLLATLPLGRCFLLAGAATAGLGVASGKFHETKRDERPQVRIDSPAST